MTRVKDKEIDVVNMMLCIKDRYNISGNAYCEMAQLCEKMPWHYKLKECVAELNKLWDIHPTPNYTCDDETTVRKLCEKPNMLFKIKGI